MAVVFLMVPLETVTARKGLAAGDALAKATGRMATAMEEAATQAIVRCRCGPGKDRKESWREN
jgi:hypothetical protein